MCVFASLTETKWTEKWFDVQLITALLTCQSLASGAYQQAFDIGWMKLIGEKSNFDQFLHFV